MSNTKDNIISKSYYDLAGYGSINQTLADARKIDKVSLMKMSRSGKNKMYKGQNNDKDLMTL